MISNELLKKKILDEAIHGRLIENDPSLKPIDVESINDDIPFEIPNNWKWAKFSNLAECRMGKTILAENLTDNGIPVYSATQENKIFGFVKNSELVLHRGDIVIPARGNSIGYATYILDKEATCTQTTICCQNIKILSKYLYFCCYAFKSLWFHFTGAAIPQITVKQLNKNLVPLPPLEEQEKIVKKIEELFELIDKKEKNNKEKEKLKTLLKEKILDSAIHGKLIKNDLSLPAIDVEEVKEDIPFDIPSNWKWTLVKNITNNIQYGYTASAIEEGNVRFLRITDIQGENINWQSVPFCNIDQNIKENYILHKNDIIVARTGGTVGKSFMINEIENCVFASYLIRLVPSNIYPKYLKYYMNTSYYWKQIWNNAKGMAQPGVNSKTLANMLITVPPFEQQKKIVEKIEECFKLIEQL